MKRGSKAGGKRARPWDRTKRARGRRRSLKATIGKIRSGDGRKEIAVAPLPDEVLEQLSSTSQILKIIGVSKGQLDLVFSTLLERAASLCDAK